MSFILNCKLLQDTNVPLLRSFWRAATAGWLRLPISLSLLALIFSQVKVAGSLRVIENADPIILIVTLALFVADRVFAGLRWHLLARRFSAEATLRTLMRLIFTSTFLAFFLPGGIGGEVLRIYGLSRKTSDLGMAVASVLVERFMALVALSALVFLGLIFAPPDLPGWTTAFAWTGVAAIVTGGIVLLDPRWRALLNGVLRGPWLAPVRVRIEKLYLCLDAYRGQPRLLAQSMVAAIFFQLFRVLQVVVAAWALGLDFEVMHFFIFVPIINLLTQIPVTVGGLGLREAAFVSLFGVVAMSAESALALSLLVYALSVAATLPGAWFYLRRGVAA